MSQVRYCMEIYLPGGRDVAVAYEADTPFMAIHAGDVLHPGFWGLDEPLGGMLIVKEVIHLLWQSGEKPIGHKLMVYTHHPEHWRELIPVSRN
jgi:hypothetical protein